MEGFTRIRMTQGGGITGRSITFTVDREDLSDKDAAIFDSELTNINFWKMKWPNQGIRPQLPIADGIQYTIVAVNSDGKKNSVSGRTPPSIPMSLQSLINLIQDHGSPHGTPSSSIEAAFLDDTEESNNTEDNIEDSNGQDSNKLNRMPWLPMTFSENNLETIGKQLVMSRFFQRLLKDPEYSSDLKILAVLQAAEQGLSEPGGDVDLSFTLGFPKFKQEMDTLEPNKKQKTGKAGGESSGGTQWSGGGGLDISWGGVEFKGVKIQVRGEGGGGGKGKGKQ